MEKDTQHPRLVSLRPLFSLSLILLPDTGGYIRNTLDMADPNPSSLDQSRSTSVTNSSRTTHQRKPSFSISSNLYAIPEKSSPSVTQQPQQQQPPSTPEKYATTTRIPHSATWRRYLDRIAGRFDSLFNPSGPLLPHDKHGGAFGGTQKRFWLASLSQPVRFLLLFYVVFSVFFTINHTWNWFFSPSVQLDERFGDHWKPERTYDAGITMNTFFILLSSHLLE